MQGRGKGGFQAQHSTWDRSVRTEEKRQIPARQSAALLSPGPVTAQPRVITLHSLQPARLVRGAL